MTYYFKPDYSEEQLNKLKKTGTDWIGLQSEIFYVCNFMDFCMILSCLLQFLLLDVITFSSCHYSPLLTFHQHQKIMFWYSFSLSCDFTEPRSFRLFDLHSLNIAGFVFATNETLNLWPLYLDCNRSQSLKMYFTRVMMTFHLWVFSFTIVFSIWHYNSLICLISTTMDY